MIEKAEKRGELKPRYTIVEESSGNTGIALALVAATKGCKMVVVMPEVASVERRTIMHYGAEVILTSGKEFGKGCEKSERTCEAVWLVDASSIRKLR